MFDAIEVHLVVIMITINIPNPTCTTFVIKNEETKGKMSGRLPSGILLFTVLFPSKTSI